MAIRVQLDERQWRLVEPFLRSDRGAGRHGRNDRMFIEAVLWWRRTGIPWRDLPNEFGPWKTVFNRFDRWSKTGKWHRLFVALKSDVDDEWQSLDSTINRVHQHASGAKGGAAQHGIGRSRGGLTTKVHLMVDALGLPMDFELSEGQRHDSQLAPMLVERCRPRCLLGDKAYDSDAIRAQLQTMKCDVVIPPKSNRTQVLSWDRDLYKARSEIECTFNLLKQARRFATRYEKTLRNYAAVVAIGCAMLWLRI